MYQRLFLERFCLARKLKLSSTGKVRKLTPQKASRRTGGTAQQPRATRLQLMGPKSHDPGSLPDMTLEAQVSLKNR